MASLVGFSPRPYQEAICRTACLTNTLICLPTGTGKTKVALMVAVERLKLFPDSQILVVTPTKPLSNQIAEEFRTNSDISNVSLLTGSISPKKRVDHYVEASVVIATPQTIQKDIEAGRVSLENFSLFVVDECHRSRQNFANTVIAKHYHEKAVQERIIALTASPGSDVSRIQEVRENLYLDAVEIRSEDDEDLKEYIQKKERKVIEVELPYDFKAIRSLLKSVFLEKVSALKKIGLSKPPSVVNKTDLIKYQGFLQSQLKKKSPSTFYGLSVVAQALKVSYALELVETQGLKALNGFFEKLNSEETKASKKLMKDRRFDDAWSLTKNSIEKGLQHPKLPSLVSFLSKELEKDASFRVIVFASYRGTVNEIVETLSLENIKAKKFVGQADSKSGKGLKQAEQIELLESFNNGEFSVLVGSSVGEEGIDIKEVSAVVFYESVGSELRSIQRAGRTGRTSAGKVVYLVTKDTRDQYLYWASLKKQQKMRKVLYDMQKQSSLEGVS